MKRINTLLVMLGLGLFGACSNESSLPQATGKGTIRAINAIESAPAVGFLIEERSIGTADFRQITAVAPYDDLEYDFNFDVFFAGDTAITRFATQRLDVVADTDYVMVLTGTIANPSITLWQAPERAFDGSETVFEARFAHTAESLGSVDYYFAAPGVAPVLGEEAGTLNFGEVVTPDDYTLGDYVLTVTANGDPANVLFQSDTATFVNADQYTISTFNGGAGTFAPIIGRAFAFGSGGTITLPDTNFPATVDFVNGSLALGTIDIYDDDLQTSRIVNDLAHASVSAELNIADGDNVFHLTPFDMNSPILVEQTSNIFRGLRGRVVGVGPVDNLRAVSYFPDRRSVVTQAKLQVMNSASNFDFLDIFAVPTGEVLTDQVAILTALPSGSASLVLALGAGNFDMYVRESGTTEILAGPIALNTLLGDVFSAAIFDTVDPAVVDLQFLPVNP